MLLTPPYGVLPGGLCTDRTAGTSNSKRPPAAWTTSLIGNGAPPCRVTPPLGRMRLAIEESIKDSLSKACGASRTHECERTEAHSIDAERDVVSRLLGLTGTSARGVSTRLAGNGT